MITKRTSLILLAFGVLVLIAAALTLNPIPQPQSYHQFADDRNFRLMENLWNVLSNVPFALVGIWGLYLLFSPEKVQFFDSRERWIWIALSTALIFTALGSAYYHMAPDNHRLVWDRLPITIVFMSFVAALVFDRISPFLGWRLWPLFICLGIFSVLYWHQSEQTGNGDLRFYLAIQGFTFLTTLIMMFTPSHYTRSKDLAFIVLFYGFAIIFEIFDRQIYGLTNGIVSGHTLKHLSASLAAFWMIWTIRKRKLVKEHKITYRE